MCRITHSDAYLAAQAELANQAAIRDLVALLRTGYAAYLASLNPQPEREVPRRSDDEQRSAPGA